MFNFVVVIRYTRSINNLMHRLLHILFLILFALPIHAQSAETNRILSYIQKAMNFNKVVPQEKVYLHFDNMGYFENETLWFKAYVSRTDNGHLSDLSKVLYVELLNPTGDVLQTLKYPIDSLGQSHGEMKLDTIMGSGLYEVRAYTRYMTNWGTNAVFSRVIPIFKKPAKEGDYSDLTIASIPYHQRVPNRRDPQDSLYVQAVAEEIYTDRLAKTISVQFYPEGGDLIVGKKCRVAMLAVDDNGHPYEGEGFVMNGTGDVLASVKTDTLGRGIFEVVPDTGRFTFQMRNLQKGENRQVQFFTLPKAKEEGCALHVDAIHENMLATLQCTDKMCGNQLGYVLMHDGNIFRCDTLTAAPLIEIELDRQAMPEGVNQMTFFDSWGRIVSERLFFLCPKPDKADSIRIVAKTSKLKPCGKVELELRTKPNANLSFSAIDAQTMTNGKQGNMKTWMLLSSEVRGYIHNVDYYFEADDKKHRQDADLLMLTQGWRRYDWRLMSERYTFRKAQPIEDQFYLNGQLKVYRKRNPVSNVRMYVSLYNQKGQSLIGNARTDSLGNYAFKMPFMDGEWKMCIYTTRDIKKKDKDKEKRKTYYVGIDRQFSPNPRYLTPLETAILHPLAPNAFVKKPFEELDEEDEFIPITERDHVLQNVTVKARKKRYFTNDDWLWKNEAYGKQYATIYYDADKELDKILDRGEPVPRTIEFIRDKLNADLDKYGFDEYYIKGRNITFVVDNNEEGGYAEWLNYVKSIYIVFNEMMSPTLGMWNIIDSPDHKIIVYIYTHRVFTTESNKGLRRTYFQGFNTASTFKTEDYSVIPPMADFRRTIWWQPDIKTDEQGKAKVEFFNNSTCEEMYISVEGMTEDGKMLVNE
ncbi:MAG: hypothetical protein J6T38_02350 [Bacteroidaceae bacterium]|nr:hypothetical protein [Bacteroidaceae bacterium]